METQPKLLAETVSESVLVNEKADRSSVIREVLRQRRVVDQQLTVYSILRDRYRRLSVATTLIILGGSLVVVAFAFTNNSRTISLGGISASRTTWMGALGLIVFFLSLVDLLVDWRRKTELYGESARRLARLKSTYRGVDLGRVAESKASDLSDAYRSVMDDAPPIRNRTFVDLKAAHMRKLRLSRLVAEYPGVSVSRLRLKLWRESVNLRAAHDGSGPLSGADGEDGYDGA